MFVRQDKLALIVNFFKVEDIPIKLHVRNHNIDYNKYYDQELIDLVYAKDSLIFKYFNYPKLELS